MKESKFINQWIRVNVYDALYPKKNGRVLICYKNGISGEYDYLVAKYTGNQEFYPISTEDEYNGCYVVAWKYIEECDKKVKYNNE